MAKSSAGRFCGLIETLDFDEGATLFSHLLAACFPLLISLAWQLATSNKARITSTLSTEIIEMIGHSRLNSSS